MVQPPPIEPGGAVGKPPLRAAGAQFVTDEVFRERIGEPVDGVAFGQAIVSQTLFG